jgi:hypothetical protein
MLRIRLLGELCLEWTDGDWTPSRAVGRGRCVRGPFDGPQPRSERGSGLVDVEVVGDDLHVQEPKDEQRESGHADECEHN